MPRPAERSVQHLPWQLLQPRERGRRGCHRSMPSGWCKLFSIQFDVWLGCRALTDFKCCLVILLLHIKFDEYKSTCKWFMEGGLGGWWLTDLEVAHWAGAPGRQLEGNWAAPDVESIGARSNTQTTIIYFRITPVLPLWHIFIPAASSLVRIVILTGHQISVAAITMDLSCEHFDHKCSIETV